MYSFIVSTIMTIYYFNSTLLYRLNSIILTVVPRYEGLTEERSYNTDTVVFLVRRVSSGLFMHDIQGGAKNGANGPSYLIANILKTP